jgi:hypothetical protein
VSPTMSVVRAISCVLEKQATPPCPQLRLPLSMNGALWPTRDVGVGGKPNYHLMLSPWPPRDRALVLRRVVLIHTGLPKILIKVSVTSVVCLLTLA